MSKDTELQVALERLLEMNGAQCTRVADAESLIALTEEVVPDLILLDLDLDEGTRGKLTAAVLAGTPKHALEFLRARVENRILERIPIIALTSRREATHVRMLSLLRVQELVMKPADPRDLFQRAQKILRKTEPRVFRFSPEHRPLLRSRIQATIVLGNEVGFLMEAPVKLTEETRVDVDSPILQQLGVSTALLQRTSTPPKMGARGQFLNEVAVIGLGKVAVERIRKILGEWK